jgi:hypothetical protein
MGFEQDFQPCLKIHRRNFLPHELEDQLREIFPGGWILTGKAGLYWLLRLVVRICFSWREVGWRGERGNDDQDILRGKGRGIIRKKRKEKWN